MKREVCDVAVIGAGAAGLAAGSRCAAAGLATVIIDREERPGGILRQCIHNGFGLHYFKEELTGPEYAARVADGAAQAGAAFKLDCTVTGVTRLADGCFELAALSPADGVLRLTARAVMLAMGCRERNRGNLAVPGSRPAGIFTAGAAQRLLNIDGMLPGQSAVIVGSGDIGLIMARRLSWCGVAVKAVVEIMPSPSGLTRNVVQCLHDFDIPLYLNHAVVNIIGRERVERIEVAPLADGVPELEKTFVIDCDTLLFSVGLLPENELSRQLGVEINPATGGAVVDAGLETSVPGVFAGGNVLHVHDLVDGVSAEAERAAAAIIRHLAGSPDPGARGRVMPGANLKYVVPNYFMPREKTVFCFRPLIAADAATLVGEQCGEAVFRQRFRFVRPAEMLEIAFEPGEGDLTFQLKAEDPR
jgi:NADPH-dependent 2,4-dienoyl-CoA reductase/sulfur reductase-like enzyme